MLTKHVFTHIHLDAVGGVAGDMFVAGLLDALPDLRERVLEDIAAVLPPECGEVSLQPGMSGCMRALRFGLEKPHGRYRPVRQTKTFGHHSESATSFPALVGVISKAQLQAGTAEQAIAILTRLAEAESHMHGVPVNKVHFHEIADWDSLMDVVAAGSIAAALEGVTWSVSALPSGHGLVKTRHGLLPVPAPATAEILKGFSWRDDGIGGERVTPTGAAILAHLIKDGQPSTSPRKLVATGTGAGTRELPGQPNILRALVFSADAKALSTDEIIVLSFDIDDMTGEEIGIAADKLRAVEGVVDLSIGSRMGKKGRPVSDFRVLVRPENLELVCELCFLETSTIGLRWHHEQRQCLPRSAETVGVDGNAFAIKRAQRPRGLETLKTESDNLAPVDGLFQRRRIKNILEMDD